MKLVLLLVAIYSMIYHQSRKEKIASSIPDKAGEIKHSPLLPDGNAYGDGFLFSSHAAIELVKPSRQKSVYQQKILNDYRYSFYPVGK